MSTTYNYVVLRLAPDNFRGEIINVGIVLFSPDARPRVIQMATLNKLRAVDAGWTSSKLHGWIDNVRTIVENQRTTSDVLDALGIFGFCEPRAVGMFSAEGDSEVARQLADIKTTYVSNKANEAKQPKEKRTRLQTALRDQFKKMHVLGESVGDIANHLVVQNVPVPSHPELKSDFVYKNGVYRVTQTIDYNVAPDSLHNKLSEACVKSTAAELALKTYGPETKRLVVLDIPEAFADATDAHVDLLLAQGFEVFHFGNAQSMANYLREAAPVAMP